MTLVATIPSNYNNGLRLITALAILTAFTILLITYGSHAVDRHGIEEVSQIRACMQQNGPTQTWRSTSDPSTYYHICLLEDGRYGLQIVVDKIVECIEKTCFIKGNGTWREVTNYLSRFATRFNGSVPH